MFIIFKNLSYCAQGRECLPLIKVNWLGISKWKPVVLLKCMHSVWTYGHSWMIFLAFTYFYLYPHGVNYIQGILVYSKDIDVFKLKFSNTDPCEREPGSAGCLFLKQIWDKLKYIFIWSKYVVVISSLLTVLGLMWV